MCVSHSVMSDSLQPHGLKPTRLLCPWGFSKQEFWSGLPFPSPGNFPNPGITPNFPAWQADCLPSGPPGALIIETEHLNKRNHTGEAGTKHPPVWGHEAQGPQAEPRIWVGPCISVGPLWKRSRWA